MRESSSSCARAARVRRALVGGGADSLMQPLRSVRQPSRRSCVTAEAVSLVEGAPRPAQDRPGRAALILGRKPPVHRRGSATTVPASCSGATKHARLRAGTRRSRIPLLRPRRAHRERCEYDALMRRLQELEERVPRPAHAVLADAAGRRHVLDAVHCGRSPRAHAQPRQRVLRGRRRGVGAAGRAADAGRSPAISAS